MIHTHACKERILVHAGFAKGMLEGIRQSHHTCIAVCELQQTRSEAELFVRHVHLIEYVKPFRAKTLQFLIGGRCMALEVDILN